MKTTITYQFGDDDCQEDVPRYAEPLAPYSFMHEFQQHLRSRWKHEEFKEDMTPDKLIDEIYEKWFELAREYDVKLY